MVINIEEVDREIAQLMQELRGSTRYTSLRYNSGKYERPNAPPFRTYDISGEAAGETTTHTAAMVYDPNQGDLKLCSNGTRTYQSLAPVIKHLRERFL